MLRALRRFRIRLLGPLFLFDLIRSTRRSRFLLFRCYVYFLLFVLACAFVVWSNSRQETDMTARDAAQLGQVMTYFLVCAQLILMIAVTPAYTGGTIAEEKDHKTLDALLTSDLNAIEIVWSKLLVRLAALLLMLLTGVPILAFLMAMGGISPELAFVSFVATLLTTASLASLGVLNSVYARHARDAILNTYLEVAVYLVVSGLSTSLLGTTVARWMLPVGSQVVTGSDIIEGFAAGNPVIVLVRMMLYMRGRIMFGPTFVLLSTQYLIFHGIVFCVCALWAAARMRAVYWKQANDPGPRRHKGRGLRKLGLERWPLVWKEVFAEPGLRFRWFGRLLLGVLVLSSFILPVYLYYLRSIGRLYDLAFIDAIGTWSRIAGAMVSCLLLLGVAVRAATCLSGERDRMTYDSLLTCPFEGASILKSKWMGAVFSIRWGWVWLGTIWGMGVFVGNLDWSCVPALLLAWLIYAGTLSAAGIWFSLISPTTLRAVIYTLLLMTFAGVGSLILPLEYYASTAQARHPDPFWEWTSRAQMGLSPPVALGSLLTKMGTLGSAGPIRHKADWELPMALLGLSLWATAGAFWWWRTCLRFRRETGRSR